MTQVFVDLRMNDPEAGTKVPASGSIWIAAVNRYHVDEADDYIVVESENEIPLVEGQATLVLDPSVPGGVSGPAAYRIREALEGAQGAFGYYLVPDTETVEYGDLTPVSWPSLQPDAEPEDAWWVALDEVETTPGPPGAPGSPGAPGAPGQGWTGGDYDPDTGVVTFTSDDGLGFETGDLRGADAPPGNYLPLGNTGVTPTTEPYVTLTNQGSQSLLHLIMGPTFTGPYLVGIGVDNGNKPGCLIANKAAGMGLAINNQTTDASGSAYGLRVTNSAPNAPGASFEATAGNAPAVSMSATQATSNQNGYLTRWSGLPAGVYSEYGYVRGSGLFTWNAQFRTTGHFDHRGTLSFFGTTGAVGVAKQVVTGSRSDGTALASLLTALAAYGLITNNTTP